MLNKVLIMILFYLSFSTHTVGGRGVVPENHYLNKVITINNRYE